MPNQYEDVEAAFAGVDTATNELADYVKSLHDEIDNTDGKGLTEAQTNTVLSRLKTLEPRLRGMGKDPANPIPVDPLPVNPLPGPFVGGFTPSAANPGARANQPNPRNVPNPNVDPKSGMPR